MIHSDAIGGLKFQAKILNASHAGLLLLTETRIVENTPVAVEFTIPISGSRIQLFGRATSVIQEKDGKMWRIGFSINDTFQENRTIEKFMTAVSDICDLQDRRQGKQNEQQPPLRNRASDYDIEWFKSPYHSFFSTLQEIAESQRIQNIVISNSIAYLHKRIRHVFPDPCITLADELEEPLVGNTLLILNLECRRKLESYTFLDFEEYRIKTNGRQDPLKTIAAVSRSLAGNAPITILSLGPIQDTNIATKILRVAKFQNIRFESDHLVRAEKRPLFETDFNKGHYHLAEVQSKQAINLIHEMASRLYKDNFHFVKEIEDLFTDSSDFYLITNLKTGEPVNFARIAHHLPGHFLPCMLAQKKGTDLHLQLCNPDKIAYGEFLAPYLKTLSMTRTYSELLKRFVNYGKEGIMDVAFTTYIIQQKRDFDFLSHYLGFKEARATLNYGDFGGDWNIVYCSKQMFDKNIKLNFLSPKSTTRLVNHFIKE